MCFHCKQFGKSQQDGRRGQIKLNMGSYRTSNRCFQLLYDKETHRELHEVPGDWNRQQHLL